MSARILVLDCERIPAWTKPLAFWSPRDLKNRYIGADDVQDWGRTICLAYRWYGERQTHFIAEWQEGGRDAYLAKVKEILTECDVLSGHNSKGFDFPHLQGDLIMHYGAKEGVVPEPKHIDTLLLARKYANWEMNNLVVLTKRLGIPTKTDKYRIATAMAAVAGDVKEQKRIESYNIGDVRASHAFLKEFLPLSNVNLGLFEDDPTKPVCPGCTSKKVQRRGFSVKAALRYPRFHCQACGKWSTGKTAIKTAGSVELRPL
jgi:hypothetical protein